jgi:hypothetical protein
VVFAVDSAKEGALQYYLEELNLINTTEDNAKSLCDNYHAGGKKIQKNESLRQCILAYQNLFKEDEIKFSFFLGYIDNDEKNVTYDQQYKAHMLEKLLKACDGKKNACGFKRDPAHEDFL